MPESQTVREATTPQTGHTPGPWELTDEEPRFAYHWKALVYKGNQALAAVFFETDASLIAAAPRMKKALERIRNRRGAHGYCLDCNVPPNTMHAESCSAFIANEAIADLPGEATNKPEGSDEGLIPSFPHKVEGSDG